MSKTLVFGDYKNIDINADLGEHGLEGINNIDKKIMPFINSCNIATGGHAGSRQTMSRLISLCLENDVNIGAHPSYPDKNNFGRKSLQMSLSDLGLALEEQLDVFFELANNHGAKVNHIKAHGALYNDACKNEELWTMLTDLFLSYDRNIKVFTLANSPSATRDQDGEVNVWPEAFIDRMYEADLSLSPRSIEGAVLCMDDALKQYQELVDSSRVTCRDGIQRKLDYKTLCIHGDTTYVFELLKSISSHE